MLQNYSSKSVAVIDLGLFVELAIKLSESFGKVYYNSPSIEAFPSSRQTEVGEGLAEIDRVDDINEIKDDVDLFVFPDTYMAALQHSLIEEKKRVWGSRSGDELEIYRSDAKKQFKKLGIEQGPYDIIKGIEKLRTRLKQNKGPVWVKIEKTRGDMESFFFDEYEIYHPLLDQLQFSLGAKAEIMTFIVEDHLKDTIDIAIDTISIDGDYPSISLLGTEEKGECYICCRKKYSECPPKLIDIYEKLRNTLKKYECRNFIALESRADKKSILLGDPAMRGGSPPLELQLNMIKNLPDLFWYGAEGKLIEPDIPSKFGVELMIHSDWAKKNPLPVGFPKELRDKIKFRYNTEFSGVTWIMPQEAGPRIAAIVEHGNNLDDIIEQAKEDAAQIKGVQVENFSRSFDIALEKIKELKSWGINLNGGA